MEPPPSLKPLKKFLNLANAMQEEEPLIAYCCRTYAAQLGIELRSKPQRPEELAFLAKIMDTLERDKPSIDKAFPNNRTDYVKNFALKVFELAKESEGTSETLSTKNGLAYLHASILIESLKQFEGVMTKEFEDMAKYAKWKAAEITRNLRERHAPSDSRMAPIIRPSADPSPAGLNQKLESDLKGVSNPSLSIISANTYKNEVPDQPIKGTVHLGFDGTNNTDDLFAKPMNPTNRPSSAIATEHKKISERPVHQVRSTSVTKPVTMQEIDVILEASKHTRSALSALEFDDTDVAVHYLHEALKVLTGKNYD
ncbi:vacuolar protein sorting-associated protein VTA1 homolog isoform X2 [Schistocerca gregaria]|uniref:vacuolar protein sorting-associated protein VTA1 homolog isoform X2 n=1 Tax=Schistocerca gregaria TaxID=7010 RepID=UPI00211E26DA|nr:vacuolar protein sorting-associated protein VTA1 homolog isoform X2 [Schistocerca gregaria]